MTGTKKNRNFRILLTAMLCGMLSFVCVLLFCTPALGRGDLFPRGSETAATAVLQPGEEYLQSVYAYRDFHHLKIFREETSSPQTLGLEIREHDQLLFSGDLPFPAGVAEQETDLAGQEGTLTLRILNRSDTPLVLPLVRDDYDPDFLVREEEPVLRVMLSRDSGTAKWTLFLAAMILFLLSLAVLWAPGAGWTQKKAMLFILAVCVVFFLLFPAWNTNDFGAHFVTAYAHANIFLGGLPHDAGDLIVREDDQFYFRYVLENHYRLYQPTGRSYDDAVDYLFRPSLQNDMTPTPFAHSVLEYGFWNYLPYILGILSARALSLNLVTAVFFARLLGMAFCLFGISRALKKLPNRALLPFTLIASVPVCAMNLTAVSYDGLCFVIVLNLLACVLSLREEYRPLHALSLLASCLALGMVKGGAYALFALALPLIPDGKDRRRIWLMILGFAALALGLAYNYRSFLRGQRDLFQFGSEGYGTYYATWAFSHPLDYLVMMVRTYLREPDKIFGAIGKYLGWNSPTLPDALCALFWILLVFSWMFPVQDAGMLRPFHRRDSVWLLLPILLLLLLTPVMLLSGTTPSMVTVDGVQGRYFLPLLLPAAILCLFRARKKAGPGGGDFSLLPGGFGLLSLTSVYYFALHFFCV